MTINHTEVNNHFDIKYRNSDTDIAIERLYCKHCDFSVGRNDVGNRAGCHVKYGGMRAKMIKHIHHEHENIWQLITQ